MTPINPFPAPSMKVFHGDPSCPRTVVIQVLSFPAGGNVFVSSDKAELDQANTVPLGATSALSAGVGVIDIVNQTATLILQKVTKDIFARGNTQFVGNVIISVEDF